MFSSSPDEKDVVAVGRISVLNDKIFRIFGQICFNLFLPSSESIVALSKNSHFRECVYLEKRRPQDEDLVFNSSFCQLYLPSFFTLLKIANCSLILSSSLSFIFLSLLTRTRFILIGRSVPVSRQFARTSILGSSSYNDRFVL